MDLLRYCELILKARYERDESEKKYIRSEFLAITMKLRWFSFSLCISKSI